MKSLLELLKALIQLDGYWGAFGRFAQSHHYLAVLAATPAIWFIAGFFFEQCVELAERIKKWSRSPFGRLIIAFSVGVSALTASALVEAVRTLNAVVPELLTVQSTVIGRRLVLQWKYQDEKGHQDTHYEVQSARDAAFKNDPQTEPQSLANVMVISRDVNDTRFWRVRAVRPAAAGSVKAASEIAPISEWSQPVQIAQYESVAERIRRTGTFTVYGSNEFNQGFFDFMDGGRVAGFDSELVKHIAERLPVRLGMQGPLRLDTKHLGFEDILELPRKGTADMIAATISKRQDRVEQRGLLFSDVYYQTTLSLIFPCEPPANQADGCSRRIQSPIAAMRQKRVGAQRGTTSAEMLKSLNAMPGGAGIAIEPLEQATVAIDRLFEKTLDFVVVDTPYAVAAERSFRNRIAHVEFAPADLPGHSKEGELYALAVRAGETELVGHINAILKALESDGTLARLKDESSRRFDALYGHADALARR